MLKDGLPSADVSMFRAQLIWISGPQCNPMIRMLLTDRGGNEFVYEGTASWREYRDWLGAFLGAHAPDQTLDKLKQLLVRNKYAALSSLIICLNDVANCGLQRVDQ